jgi:hypothetical protein
VTCPGLHCPGCSGRQSLGVLAALVAVVYIADQACTWVADRIWWIGSTLALCFALAVAASMWLEHWSDRRGAKFAARHGIVCRADVILPPPVVRAVVTGPVPERAALAPPAITVNIFGMPSAEQAEVIGQALERNKWYAPRPWGTVRGGNSARPDPNGDHGATG